MNELNLQPAAGVVERCGRVAVLMGGDSAERAVSSFHSGSTAGETSTSS